MAQQGSDRGALGNRTIPEWQLVTSSFASARNTQSADDTFFTVLLAGALSYRTTYYFFVSAEAKIILYLSSQEDM